MLNLMNTVRAEPIQRAIYAIFARYLTLSIKKKTKVVFFTRLNETKKLWTDLSEILIVEMYTIKLVKNYSSLILLASSLCQIFPKTILV